LSDIGFKDKSMSRTLEQKPRSCGGNAVTAVTGETDRQRERERGREGEREGEGGGERERGGERRQEGMKGGGVSHGEAGTRD
jgi:hypothetical protein